MSTTTRIIQPRDDGRWEVVAPNAQRASAVTETKAQAERRGREILGNAGGGELQTRSELGRIIEAETVPDGSNLFQRK